MTEETPEIGQKDLEDFSHKFEDWAKTLTEKENTILIALLQTDEEVSGLKAGSVGQYLNFKLSSAFGVSTSFGTSGLGGARKMSDLDLNRESLGEFGSPPPPCEMGFSCSASNQFG